MGIAITRDEFEEADFHRFAQRLEHNLLALGQLLARPGFGRGKPSIGAELEMFLVDRNAQPIPINEQVLVAADNPRLTLELNRFNLEYNTDPGPVAGRPFTALKRELTESLSSIRRLAHAHDARVALIGILPTLRREHLTAEALSNVPRFQALARGLRRLRPGPFHFDIDGADPLQLDWQEVTFEGANSSLQLHLRVEPEQLARTHNAAQLATAPAVAVAGNSPTFLGHRLWHETRVALFKQAVDARSDHGQGRAPPRVSFGQHWLSQGAIEWFAEAARAHPPLLPITHTEDAVAEVDAGRVPQLLELRVQNSTVWHWNRGVYDPSGHVRIELRSLPGGPTLDDMLGNAAFLLGLTQQLASQDVASMLPFEAAHNNFYRAAQHGLQAQLEWPAGPGLQRIRAGDLVPRLIPQALEGLLELGVDRAEAEYFLSLISERAESGMTGSVWQLNRLRELSPGMPGLESLQRMTQEYLALSEAGNPVHRWP